MYDEQTLIARAARSSGGVKTVRAGFIPLVDSAILVVAAELEFAGEEGIDLRLTREASWANIRDRITLGYFDCAHILAGIPIASALGIGNPMARMIAPFAMGLNGNAVTVSSALYECMAAAGGLDGAEGPAKMAAALAEVIAEDRRAGRPQLTLGMVYPFSSHNYELRYWLGAAGIHPDHDVRLAVIPPPLIVDYMRGGYIDGFCVGAPWNTLAVEEGIGRIVATKADLWKMSSEKVLGVRADWAEAHPETLDALIRALEKAARWAEDPVNRWELATLLARPEYVGVSAKTLLRIIEGQVQVSSNGEIWAEKDFIVLNRQGATFPRIPHALWFYSQMVRWGQVEASAEGAAAAAATARPDLYLRALSGLAHFVPPDHPQSMSSGGEDGFFDGKPFDPAQLDAYIASFDVHSRARPD